MRVKREIERISGVKTCAKCDRVFPNTLDFFTKNNQSRDGLHYYCRVCRADHLKNKRNSTTGIKVPQRLDREIFNNRSLDPENLSLKKDYIGYINFHKESKGQYPTLLEMCDYFKISPEEMTDKLDRLLKLGLDIKIRGSITKES